MVFTDHPQPDFSMPKTSEGIRGLTHINGLSIREIETRMRPGAYSVEGFLGKNESLLEILIQDNETVEQLGLTHEEIALNIRQLYNALGVNLTHNERASMGQAAYSKQVNKLFSDGKIIELNGKRFLVQLRRYEREGNPIQESPMGDNYRAAQDVHVIDLNELEESGVEVTTIGEYNEAYILGKIPNLNTAQRVYSLTLIHLISKYGFYEGIESPWRQSPEDIASFLNIQSKNK